MELPKKKQPPRNIWHNEYQINLWFEEVFDEDYSSDTLEFSPNEVD